MSILKYLHFVKQKLDLPDSSGSLKKAVSPIAIAAASAEVPEAFSDVEVNKSASRSSGSYSFLPSA